MSIRTSRQASAPQITQQCSALYRAAKQVRADQRTITEASRQSSRELACWPAIKCTSRCVLQTMKSVCLAKNIPGTTIDQAVEAGMVREGLAYISRFNGIQHCARCASFYRDACMLAGSGLFLLEHGRDWLFSWRMEMVGAALPGVYASTLPALPTLDTPRMSCLTQIVLPCAAAGFWAAVG